MNSMMRLYLLLYLFWTFNYRICQPRICVKKFYCQLASYLLKHHFLLLPAHSRSIIFNCFISSISIFTNITHDFQSLKLELFLEYKMHDSIFLQTNWILNIQTVRSLLTNIEKSRYTTTTRIYFMTFLIILMLVKIITSGISTLYILSYHFLI